MGLSRKHHSTYKRSDPELARDETDAMSHRCLMFPGWESSCQQQRTCTVDTGSSDAAFYFGLRQWRLHNHTGEGREMIAAVIDQHLLCTSSPYLFLDLVGWFHYVALSPYNLHLSHQSACPQLHMLQSKWTRHVWNIVLLSALFAGLLKNQTQATVHHPQFDVSRPHWQTTTTVFILKISHLDAAAELQCRCCMQHLPPIQNVPWLTWSWSLPSSKDCR